MPYAIVYVAGRGTILENSPDPSAAGHMWYTLDPGNGGEVESYGFAPGVNKHSLFPVVGEVKNDDNINYLSHEYARTIEITQAQYDALKAFANAPAAYGFDQSSYWAPSNSCIDFVWKALDVAGLLYPAIDKVKAITIYLIASCVYQSSATGRFDCKNKVFDATKRCSRWRGDRLNSKNALAYLIRFERHEKQTGLDKSKRFGRFKHVV